jgi:hypothetical protein
VQTFTAHSVTSPISNLLLIFGMHFSLECAVRKHLKIGFRKDITAVFTVGNFGEVFWTCGWLCVRSFLDYTLYYSIIRIAPVCNQQIRVNVAVVFRVQRTPAPHRPSYNCILKHRGADKSLARPASQYILFDGENISFDANLVLYIYRV